MNNKLSTTCLILVMAPFVFGCGGPGNEASKINASADPAPLGEKYNVDTSESVVTWKGSMVLSPKDKHVGYVHISKGELIVDKGQLKGGKFEIDMTSIEYKDKEEKNTPVHHLKSADYFDVEKFPVSKMEITSVAAAGDKTLEITGNLTIKGVTQPVTFPAKMEVKDGMIEAAGQLVIDRTDWGIRYRSGKFYDVVADQVVSDDIEFEIKIVAKK